MRPSLCKRFALALALGALAGCGGGGGGGGGPPATATLSSSATDVPVNGAVTLTWSSTNAASCTASGGWSGALATSGSSSVPVPSKQTYTLTCGTATSSVTVTAWNHPTATLDADTTTVLVNNSAQLTWSSQDATSCVGSGGLPAAIATSGSQATAALTTTTSYAISCSNPAYPSAANAAVTITVDTVLTLTVAVQYQAPGPPVLNAAGNYVPDWAHPLASPVPLVYVELDDASGKLLQSAFADSGGVATFTGLSPTASYTPKIQSRIQNAPLGLDFVVLNNTAPLDTTQPTFRGRYGPYTTVGPAYTPSGKSATQAVTLTLPDGWDAATSTLVDANRVSGPYELLAFAVLEAQTVSGAIGGTPTWKPLTILWSVKNQGGLAAPPNNFDQGIVTGIGGYYDGTHEAIDASGAEGTTNTFLSEPFIYLSGDQTQEPMEIYPFVMTHEMGHFVQAQFSTIVSPQGSHAFTDDEDQLLAWIEGSASGIAALVMNTPEQRRLLNVSGQILVNVYDTSTNTLNGNPQAWPVGWYQESTTTNLMWSVSNPAGAIALTTQATLAPMFSSTWTTAPWLNTVWAYLSLLTDENPGSAVAIDSWGDAHNITATGNDAWGANESHVPANRSAVDVLPPYVPLAVGQTINVCSAGAPLEYNKAGNARQLKLLGDGAMHTLSVTGPTGTVPVLGTQFNPGSNLVSLNGTIPAGGSVIDLGDCAVILSEFASGEAACMENGVPPAETCWSVTLQ